MGDWEQAMFAQMTLLVVENERLRAALDRIGNHSVSGYVGGFEDPREYRPIAVYARDVLEGGT